MQTASVTTPPAPAVQVDEPDAALLGAALGLCALALAGGVLVTRVRREAGLA